MIFPTQEVEKKLGYTFHDKGVLKQAFTHSSYANIWGEKDNERMEYLGDAVLQLIVTEWQYQNDKRAEGKLSASRQHFVRKEALDSLIDGLGVFEYLIFSGSKDNLGDKTKSDLFEAIVAAIYLDGGYFPARKFVLEHGNLSSEEEVQNHKGALQEWLQERGENPPQYRSVKSGKDHAPIFQCVATALGEKAEGEGRTIKEAEAFAASRLLWELKKKYGEHSPTKKRKK
ncbi:MAG: ribonuclease III [Clostridia bacterium]|nr:ribonuclease III [Clostridia bacterium]MBP3423150.1 ribonuclease III [Clostridia bacterium]